MQGLWEMGACRPVKDLQVMPDQHAPAGAYLHRTAGPLQAGACAAGVGAAELRLSSSSQANGILAGQVRTGPAGPCRWVSVPMSMYCCQG